MHYFLQLLEKVNQTPLRDTKKLQRSLTLFKIK